MGQHVEIEGLKDLQKALRIAGSKDLKKELRQAQKSSADIVSRRAKVLAPKDTGKLAASIRPGASMRSGYVKAGGKRVPYAGPIHFGWKRRNIAPNPFLFEALAASRSKIVREHQKSMDDLVAKIHKATP